MDADIKQKRWQDLGNILLGIWLFFSPLVLGYTERVPVAAQNAFIIGLAIVVFAAVAVYIPRVWEEWINMALGIWLIVSPWVLGFSDMRNVMVNIVIVGVLVAALATWAMTRDKAFQKWRHDHQALQ